MQLILNLNRNFIEIPSVSKKKSIINLGACMKNKDMDVISMFVHICKIRIKLLLAL